MSATSIPKPTSVDERYQLLRSVGEECTTEAELRNLIEKKPEIRCYDGFEPSGRMHIAQGIYKSINVNKCTASGCKFVFWVADWFALMNDKMGGELEKIRVVGKYLVEVWRSAGMDMSNVEFLWSSELINKHHADYWKIVMDVGRRNTIARVRKCCTIMGKKEGTLTAAQVMYPLMQCADIFFLKADICQLGLDQRKVNMMAREYCDQIGRKLKPVVLSHHMLAGLKAGQAKMSKSDPDSAIFMEDSAEDVERKILAAYCPKVRQTQKEVTEEGLAAPSDDTNPCLDYLKCIVFGNPVATLQIGEVEYKSYEEVESAFIEEKISEEQLKRALITAVNARLDPVRRHFVECPEAKQLLETIKGYKKGAVVHEAPKTEGRTPKLVAWVPTATRLPLGAALGLVKAMNDFIEQNNNNNAEAVLVLPNLSAVARNELTGEEKDVTAALTYNELLLRHYGLRAEVKTIKQSDIVAENPNDYWIQAISVGRKYMLERIEEATGELHNGGMVMAALMRVTDAERLHATQTLSLPVYDAKQNELITDFTSGAVSNTVVHTVLPKLCDPNKDNNNGDNNNNIVGVDDVLFADDTDMDTRRKLKKAFAAPEDPNTPVVAIAAYFLQQQQLEANKNNNGDNNNNNITASLTVPRAPEHGGDILIHSEEELISKYKDGSVHPGDLKALVTERLLQRTSTAREGVKGAEMKKLSTALRQIEKKMSSKK